MSKEIDSLKEFIFNDEVQKVFDKVVKNLENQIGAQLR